MYIVQACGQTWPALKMAQPEKLAAKQKRRPPAGRAPTGMATFRGEACPPRLLRSEKPAGGSGAYAERKGSQHPGGSSIAPVATLHRHPWRAAHRRRPRRGAWRCSPAGGMSRTPFQPVPRAGWTFCAGSMVAHENGERGKFGSRRARACSVCLSFSIAQAGAPWGMTLINGGGSEVSHPVTLGTIIDRSAYVQTRGAMRHRTHWESSAEEIYGNTVPRPAAGSGREKGGSAGPWATPSLWSSGSPCCRRRYGARRRALCQCRRPDHTGGPPIFVRFGSAAGQFPRSARLCCVAPLPRVPPRQRRAARPSEGLTRRPPIFFLAARRSSNPPSGNVRPLQFAGASGPPSGALPVFRYFAGRSPAARPATVCVAWASHHCRARVPPPRVFLRANLVRGPSRAELRAQFCPQE
ncbi:unnamed protein product [Amoebophrya sp. A120]|nr:unnamed protein product [Amoebophrya sp. A120]|eukprot:GSA120T00013349001.1